MLSCARTRNRKIITYQHNREKYSSSVWSEIDGKLSYRITFLFTVG